VSYTLLCCTPLRDIAGKKIEKNKNLTIEAPNDAMWVKFTDGINKAADYQMPE